MKTILSTLLLFISVQLFAQNPLEKNVGDFNTVKVYDLIKVNLIKSDINKVVITGDDVEDVEVINKDGKLKIRMHIDKIFDGKRTFVEVHYTKLNVIDGNEGAQIIGNELIEQSSIQLRTQEGAHINVGLQVTNLDARAVTGGIITTKGTATVQDVVVNTGGIYNGKELITDTTKVSIKAGGEADVYATKHAEAKTRAGGDIYIYGDPDTIKDSRVFGGRIEKISKNGKRVVID